MRINEYFIVFPEGDIQEIQGRLGINQIVDINGNPLDLPLPSPKTIAYRVEKVSAKESRGGTETFHYLCLMSADELSPYARR